MQKAPYSMQWHFFSCYLNTTERKHLIHQIIEFVMSELSFKKICIVSIPDIAIQIKLICGCQENKRFIFCTFSNAKLVVSQIGIY